MMPAIPARAGSSRLICSRCFSFSPSAVNVAIFAATYPAGFRPGNGLRASRQRAKRTRRRTIAALHRSRSPGYTELHDSKDVPGASFRPCRVGRLSSAGPVFEYGLPSPQRALSSAGQKLLLPAYFSLFFPPIAVSAVLLSLRFRVFQFAMTAWDRSIL